MHPILFKIGSFPVHTYGEEMVVAFIAAIALVQWRAPKYGIKKEQIGDLAFWVLIAGVLGARIVFILQDLDYYRHHVSELLSLQFRGLTSFGGLIFGAGAAIIWAIKKKVPIMPLLDLLAPAFVLGHAIGRVGCLLNGCCFGGVCPPNLPWGIHVEGSTVLHHPAQAYDTLMNLVVVGILLFRERFSLAIGQITGLALMLHGLTRFIYEFWRAGTDEQVEENLASSTYWGNSHITQAQVMALAIILTGFVIYVVSVLRKRTSTQHLASEATPA